MPEDQTTPEGERERAPGDTGAVPPEGPQASGEGADGGGGYEYVVADGPERSGPPLPLLLAVAAIVPAVIVGLAVWFLAPGSGGGTSHANQDVASVLNAFTSQQGSTSTRFEGTLPPGLPKDLPVYPGSDVVSSLEQVQGTDVAYLIVYDTTDDLATVAKYFEGKLSADPWQLTGGQTDKNGVVHQFANTSDPNISGLVLVAASNNEKVTTVLESVQVAAGAADVTPQSYSPGTDFALPANFPSNVPKYPESTTVQSAYRKQAQGDSFAVAFVTADDAQKVLSFYRDKLSSAGYTVTDSSAAGATPEAGATPTAATGISFTDASGSTNGQISTSTVEEDSSFTRIDIQLGITAGSPSSGSSTPSAGG